MYFPKTKNAGKEVAGGFNTRLKSMKVSWDDEIPNFWKNSRL